MSKLTSVKKTVHFLGIAGSGASAAAALAIEAGFKVTGCDLDLTQDFAKFFTKDQLSKGHSKNHLNNIDILAITPAILSLDPNSEELKEARARKIKIMTWQQFVGKFLLKDKFVIAVCGTHGKSTTTAMIAKVLEDAKMDPSVLIGTFVPSWNANFRIGASKYFVIEADEFNDNYLSIKPDLVVVTNIEMDHPEYFKDFSSYKRSFQNFLHNAKQMIFANLSDPIVAETLAFHPRGGNSNYGRFFKPVVDYSKNMIDFSLRVPGQFNILNASATYQVGLNLGIEPKIIRNSLSSYTGISRRMEELGEINGAKIISDFGHHPTEIKVTIEALRQKYDGRRIFVVYQPHMFSRTKALFEDFVKVFKNLKVEGIVIVDIYPSREVDPGNISSKDLVEAVGQKNIEYTPKVEQVIENIKPHLTENDVIIFMGAGDIDVAARKFVSQVIMSS